MVQFDDLLEGSRLLIAIGAITPVHVIAYYFFEKAFSKQKASLKTARSLIKFTTERFSAAKGLISGLSSYSASDLQLLNSGTESIEIDIIKSSTKKQNKSDTE